MIQMRTRLDVADNSGAKSVMCIKVLGEQRNTYDSMYTIFRFGDYIYLTRTCTYLVYHYSRIFRELESHSICIVGAPSIMI